TSSLEEIVVADTEILAVIVAPKLILRSIEVPDTVTADEAPKAEEVRDKLSEDDDNEASLVDDDKDSLDDDDSVGIVGGIGAADVALAAFISAGWLLNP
ncbi:hypothetical protein GGF41_005293, partial [Coemansia sp. RSA 2531]